jgi:hypothetical protein
LVSAETIITQFSLYRYGWGCSVRDSRLRLYLILIYISAGDLKGL